MARTRLGNFIVGAMLFLLVACGQNAQPDVDGARDLGTPDVTPLDSPRLETSDTGLGRGLLQSFRRGSAEVDVQVNRYLWNASLEVLDFLPVQSVDPFTGVIVTGFGTPPGTGRAYRATVLIDDPALEARSLKVALQSRSGPVAASTVRAIEDAILTRARQLRVADSRL